MTLQRFSGTAPTAGKGGERPFAACVRVALRVCVVVQFFDSCHVLCVCFFFGFQVGILDDT